MPSVIPEFAGWCHDTTIYPHAKVIPNPGVHDISYHKTRYDDLGHGALHAVADGKRQVDEEGYEEHRVDGVPDMSLVTTLELDDGRLELLDQVL